MTGFAVSAAVYMFWPHTFNRTVIVAAYATAYNFAMIHCNSWGPNFYRMTGFALYGAGYVG